MTTGDGTREGTKGAILRVIGEGEENIAVWMRFIIQNKGKPMTKGWDWGRKTMLPLGRQRGRMDGSHINETYYRIYEYTLLTRVAVSSPKC